MTQYPKAANRRTTAIIMAFSLPAAVRPPLRCFFSLTYYTGKKWRGDAEKANKVWTIRNDSNGGDRRGARAIRTRAVQTLILPLICFRIILRL